MSFSSVTQKHRQMGKTRAVSGLQRLRSPRVTEERYPSSVTLREGNLQKPYQSINTSYPIRKSWWMYLLLEKNLAIASYTKALEFRNGKCFRRVTEEGYDKGKTFLSKNLSPKTQHN